MENVMVKSNFRKNKGTETNNSLKSTCVKLPTGEIRYGLTNDYMFRAVLQKMTESLFDDVKDFYSEYLMMNTKNQRIFSRNFSLRVLQLSQLETASNTEKASELYQWAKLFLAKTWEELQMIAKDSNVMQETTRCLYELSEEENIRLLCEGRERYRMDMDCARDEGFEHGLQLGETQKLVEQICKKIKKNYSVPRIADMLEENENIIQVIYDVAKSFSPDYNENAIMGKLKETAGYLFTSKDKENTPV